MWLGANNRSLNLVRPPTNLSVVSVTTTAVTLNWTTTNASSYNLYRNGVLVKSGTGLPPYTDSGLSPSTTYTYAVTAVVGGLESPPSNSVAPTTGTPAGNLINFDPGIYLVGGNLGSYHGFTGTNGWSPHIDKMRSLISGWAPQGAFATFGLGQCEGAKGDYSALFTEVDLLLGYCQPLGLNLGININISGNINSASVPSYMLNNTTYGQVVSGTGYKGGLFSGTNKQGGTTNVVRFDIPATAARIAAIGTALWNNYGTSLYALNATWSEIEDMSSFVAEMTPTAIINSFAGSGGMYDQLRAGMPQTFLMSGTSYMPTSVMAQLFGATDRNKMSCGAYDMANELPVRSGGNQRFIGCIGGFRGVSLSGTTYSPVAGLVDRRANVVGGGRDAWGHLGPDELGGSTGSTTSGNVVPPARLGDGDLLNASWPQVLLQQMSHVLVYGNQQTGPACNSIGPSGYTPAANYSSATWANLMQFFANHNVTPAQNYPSFWS